jgi:muconolactone delta-isomerase
MHNFWRFAGNFTKYSLVVLEANWLANQFLRSKLQI